MLCIKNGMIHDAVNPIPYQADIWVEHGKIVKIVSESEVSEADQIIDASGKQIYPGFVEAHGHIGLDGYGIGYEGKDYNEYGDIVTPQLRAIDGIQPFDYAWKEAAAAGVTCVATGPGSSNVLGGVFAAVKTTGMRVEDMLVKQSVAMKCAFGENPKRCYKDKGNSSRMTTASRLREMLFKAKEYMERMEAAGDEYLKRPKFDMKLEALLPVLRKEIPLKAHAHQLDDMFTAIRIAKEFDVNLTLEHCTEGHLAPELLAKEQIPMAVGPSLGHATKFELRNKSWTTPGVLDRAGCHVSIITDSPVIPQKYLPLCAGMAVKAGMDPYRALRAITIHPAEHLGIENRVGSLEVGKDADIVMTDGCPFDVQTKVYRVWINGQEVSTDLEN